MPDDDYGDDYEPEDEEPDYEPEDYEPEDPGKREWVSDEEYEDGWVKRARPEILKVIAGETDSLFYERQLQVKFERTYYHWITSRALRELVEEDEIGSEYLPLGEPAEDGGGPRIRFFFPRKTRSWRRRAKRIVQIVERNSSPEFNRAIGHHAEMLFDAGLAAAGFTVEAKNASEFRGIRWSESNHNLDRIYLRDGVGYGAEVKNKLGYPDWADEIETKLRICRHLSLRPLIISRALPKSWNWRIISEWRGFALLFEKQLYPFGHTRAADEARSIGLSVDCPQTVPDGHIKRFLNWHLKLRNAQI